MPTVQIAKPRILRAFLAKDFHIQRRQLITNGLIVGFPLVLIGTCTEKRELWVIMKMSHLAHGSRACDLAIVCQHCDSIERIVDH
jgi:hypothetical protein